MLPAQTPAKPFLCGIIEGFYGREWAPQLRCDYAAYLARGGLNTYIYCPKGDPCLRREWTRDWDPDKRGQMIDLAGSCADHGVQFGVGLSPFELYLDYGSSQKVQLQRKIESLAELEAPLLAVLFDDMPGDVEHLAQRQVEIVEDVCRWSVATRVLVCPTYYSCDPMLESHFGSRPGTYWEDLGRLLPADVDVFWTGNEVCSETIRVADLDRITQALERTVVLWDNYPVNDGARRSRYLYTQPLEGREAGLQSHLSGHLCNPMNQGMLSLPALAGLAELHGRDGYGHADLEAMLGQQLLAALREDGCGFRQQGLDGMGEERCEQLALRYQSIPGPAAAEVAAWLRGEYAFDPACLTG